MSWTTSPTQTTPYSMNQAFDWGTSSGDLSNSATVVSLGSGNWDSVISGLQASTTYYYEIFASATCWNTGTGSGSFTIAVYPTEIYSFEGFGNVQISGPSQGSGTFSNGSVTDLLVGTSYTLDCSISSSMSSYMATSFGFGSWVSQGGLSVTNPNACDTSVAVTGGSGSGVIGLELAYKNSVAYVQANPVTLGGYSSGEVDTYTLAGVPIGGYVYGSEYAASTYPEGTVYQAGGTFVIPTTSYDSFSISGVPYTGPEVLNLWVGIGGYNYWDNSETDFNDGIVGSLWQAGVAVLYTSSTSSPLVFPWVEGNGYPDPYCFGTGGSLPSSNAVNCDPVNNALNTMQPGDTIQVTVAVQPCNPGQLFYSAEYAIISDLTRGTSLDVNYWYINGASQNIQGCMSGIGPVYYPDYHTAEWMVEVPTGAVAPSVTSGGILFTGQEVSPTVPTSYSGFLASPCPSSEYNDGFADPLAYESTDGIVSGTPVTYEIYTSSLSPLGTFYVYLT